MSDVAQIVQRLGEFEKRLATAERERDEYRALYLETMGRCRKLELGLLASKSERVADDGSQLSLDVLTMVLTERQRAQLDAALEAAAEAREVKAHTRRPPTGRKPLPEHLPRVVIEVVPPEVEKKGLDAFERIGEDVCETIERRLASFVVARVVRPKFVAKDRERDAETEVLVAEPLALPIPRGLAGTGMLADTIVKRWQDHTPLNRMEDIYGRDGVELARSTICGWHGALADLAKPLVAAMREDAFKQPYLCVDATGVLVQAKEKCRRGYFWVLIADQDHVLFRFTPRHTQDGPREFLRGYRGYVLADAHNVYELLYRTEDVTEVGCWAHCRRGFFKALSSDKERALAALGFIGKLYAIDADTKELPPARRTEERRRLATPVLEAFRIWLDVEALVALPKSPIGQAIGYARNQWAPLTRFLDDGRLRLDNNGSELELRRQAVGRKNWLFVGSDEGAEWNTIAVSLIASCQLHGIEPWAYLRDVLILLPDWPRDRVLELSPKYWKQTLEQTDARQRLDRSIWRRVSSTPPSS